MNEVQDTSYLKFINITKLNTMRDKTNRLSKYDYFMKRFTEATDNGNKRKADYYADRINQLRMAKQEPITKGNVTRVGNDLAIHGKATLSKADKKSRVKEHFDTLTEGDRITEMNKFIKQMADKGMTINQSVAFLNSCGLDSTEIAHATTF
jgi:hypothetical protein|tara:strand:- start:3021 stop:3473 length:453 start_codon:yes stop_codon:yes gene_type:complete